MGNTKRNNEINKLFVMENIHNGIFSGSSVVCLAFPPIFIQYCRLMQNKKGPLDMKV